MRGAVSVALAYYFFDRGSSKVQSGVATPATLIVSTLVVVLFTVLVLGNLTNTLTQVCSGCSGERVGSMLFCPPSLCSNWWF